MTQNEKIWEIWHKWLFGLLSALLILAVTFLGRTLWNHEGRIIRLEQTVDQRLDDIEESLDRIYKKMP